jgi:hypothetical protein
MMAALTRQRCWTLPLLGSISLLGFSCLALHPSHHSIANPATNLPKTRFHLLSPSSGPLIRPRSQASRLPVLNASQSFAGEPTVFDPVLAYATFLGGSGGTSNTGAFFVDNTGDSYVAGFTGSQNFPTTPGVIGSSNPNPGSAAVGLSEVNPTGNFLIFSTYIPGLAEIDALVLDSAGDIYVAGKSICATPVSCPSMELLPIPTGTTPFQASPRSIGIIKLNSTATAVLGATYLGGSSQDTPRAIASDSDGNLYVTGGTSSNDFPTLNPLQGSLGANGENAFITKFNPTLSTLLYSTYLGQDPSSIGNGIAVDSSKDAYVAGSFNPAIGGDDFPLTQNAFEKTCSGNLGCGFLSELSPDGSTLLYSTFAGLAANAVAVDGHGNSFIGGQAQAPYSFSPTLSTCFAIVPAALSPKSIPQELWPSPPA